MSASDAPAPIASAGEAEDAIARLDAIMDRLMLTVQEETARVRAGHLRHAAELVETKSDLARHYAAESVHLKTGREIVASLLPDALERLRQRHAAFQSLLQTNLTVLATAHAVAEGIIRGVAGELARKQTPSTYGASGRANPPNAKASPPLALSRTF